MEIVPKNVHWLLPEEPSPCDIFLHFRGQYAVAIPSGRNVSFKLLEKLAKARCTLVYIRSQDEQAWQGWARARCPAPHSSETAGKKKDDETTHKVLYGNKRAELLSYVQKSALKKTESDRAIDQAFTNALELLQKVIQQPTLDWYFRQFHEPPNLFQHNARVAFCLAIFMNLSKMATDEEMEAICYSALIHELEGNPTENMKTVVSQQTLALLEKNKHPVPKNVIDMIQTHDELCSGKGFPNNKKGAEIPVAVRLFTLFNHFDSYRLQCTGTRRARFEKAKEMMEARQADYDSSLWPLFWSFWEKHVETVA